MSAAAFGTTFIAECNMPTTAGVFKMRAYKHSSPTVTLEPIVMVGKNTKLQDAEDVIVRVHDQCCTSEVFGSMRCDCREQLHNALSLIDRDNGGLVIYLQQEGRGVGLPTKVQLYKLIDEGYDTVTSMEAMGLQSEYREYGAVADILKELGVKSIKLISNNPYKVEKLTALGVKINGRVASHMPPNEHNIGYLRAKRDLMDHKLDHVDNTDSETETASQSPVPVVTGEDDVEGQ